MIQPTKESIRGLRKTYTDRSILFHPSWVEVLGGIPPVIMLSQLLYWTGTSSSLKRGSIYKTVEQMQEETSLSKVQQQLARKKLIERGVLRCWRGGPHARWNYRVNLERMAELLRDARSNSAQVLEDENVGPQMEYIDDEYAARYQAKIEELSA